MSDRPSACPSWKRRDACEAWGAQGPRTCLRRAALHFDIFLGTESPAALTAHRVPGLRSSSYTVLWPSQGENVASYLQIEKLEDFKAAPAKSLAEHWAQCGWTVPTNSWASLQDFPSLSSRVQAWGPLLWEVGGPGKQGRQVGWTAAGRSGPQVGLQTCSQAPGIRPPPSHPQARAVWLSAGWGVRS